MGLDLYDAHIQEKPHVPVLGKKRSCVKYTNSSLDACLKGGLRLHVLLYLDALLEAPVAEHVEAFGDDPVLFLVLADGALDHLEHESKPLRPKRQAGMQTKEGGG